MPTVICDFVTFGVSQISLVKSLVTPTLSLQNYAYIILICFAK